MKRWKLVMVFTAVFGMMCFLGGAALAEKPIIIGSPLPLTGPYASDGEQMKMALEMAVDEYNENGGLVGRKIKIIFGDVGGLEAEKIKAVGERLVSAGANAIITGYDDGGVDTKVFGQYDIPYLHCNSMTLCTAPVARNPDKYWNVFQYIFNEIDFGKEAFNNIFTIPQKMGWTPPNKKIAVIKADYSWSIIPADYFAERSAKIGYEVVLNETVPFGVAEWGPILSKIESEKPSYITFWHLDPTDGTRFMKQFSERFLDDGIESIVFMNYLPSIPEFLELAGTSANGLVWTAGGRQFGDKWDDFTNRWVKRYGKGPAGLSPYYTRDGFDIWANAVKRAECADCYRDISRQIREAVHEGIYANYAFNPSDQSAIYGEHLFPQVWNQVWDGKSTAIEPKSFKNGDYRKPPWMKK
jgi:branched-chain amino acid transport system substrate-binding protein